MLKKDFYAKNDVYNKKFIKGDENSMKDYFMTELIRNLRESKESVGNALADIFDYNSHGENWYYKYDDLLPVVLFAKDRELYHGSVLTGKEDELYNTCSYFKNVLEKLEIISEKESDIQKKAKYKRDIYEAKKLLIYK